MAGTAAGGFVVGTGGFGWIAAFDAITFLLIGLGLSRIRADQVMTAPAVVPVVKVMLSGFRYLWKHVLVRLSLFRAMILNGLGMALINIGLVLQAQSRGWSSAQLAVIDVALAIGMAVTGIVFTHLESPRRAGLLAGWGFVVFSMLQLCLLLIPVYPVVIVLAALVGAVLVPTSSISDGIVQNAIPAERLGTINGAMITVSLGAIPLGNAVFGFAADQLTPSRAITWFGTAMFVICLVLAGVQPLRTATLPRSSDDAT
jgi:ENTS family enterobactin (siderophore) exporter